MGTRDSRGGGMRDVLVTDQLVIFVGLIWFRVGVDGLKCGEDLFPHVDPLLDSFTYY